MVSTNSGVPSYQLFYVASNTSFNPQDITPEAGLLAHFKDKDFEARWH